mgnify:CR=1 FL=1
MELTPELLTAAARLIAQAGFPAAAAIFLLWWLVSRLNGKLDRLSDAMEALPDRLADRLADKMEITLRRILEDSDEKGW